MSPFASLTSPFAPVPWLTLLQPCIIHTEHRPTSELCRCCALYREQPSLPSFRSLLKFPLENHVITLSPPPTIFSNIHHSLTLHGTSLFEYCLSF